MSKYNKTNKKSSPYTINKMGENAYTLDSKSKLVSLATTTFMDSSYYKSGNEIALELEQLVNENDPLFVAKLAVYLRHTANMRSVSHFLTAILAKRISGKEWAKKFYTKVVNLPTDISEIISILKIMSNGEKLKLPNAMKKGFSFKLSSFDAYQLDKYKMSNKDISLVDLVRLLHPKPKSYNSVAFEKLIKGESLKGLYETKILEKEKSEAGKSGSPKTVSEAISETLNWNGQDTPIMNLIRNLASIVRNSPSKIDLVCEILENKEKLIRSRLLPIRFLQAYLEVEKTIKKMKKESVLFSSVEMVKKIDKLKNSLEKAFENSIDNIPVLNGNVAILIDHSGSMRGGNIGSSSLSNYSSSNTSEIADLFASMLAKNQKDGLYIGLFGDKLEEINYDFTRSVLENASFFSAIGGTVGGSSENGLFVFLDTIIEKKQQVDYLIVFSDMVIGRNSWYGHGKYHFTNDFDDIYRKFRKLNPFVKTMSVNLRSDGNTVFNKNLGVHQVSGWSSEIFKLLDAYSVGYEKMIEEIENVNF